MPDTPDVLVIGAGLAGLAAAQALQARGSAVVVLEGRERIGGRIWTSERWPDLPLDLGASWIHGTKGNPLTSLADRLKARRVTTHYDRSVAYRADGTPLTDRDEAQLERLRAALKKAIPLAQEREGDTSLRAVAEPIARRLGIAQRFLDFVLSADGEQEYAGSAAQLSAHWHDSATSFPGDDAVFADGFHTLTRHLARGLSVATGEVVREIDWSGAAVRVVTNRGEHTAAQVLVTLPLGVLKAGVVRFTPALPADKRAAIARLGMGVLNKCYLRFPRAFWPREADWLEYVAPRHGEWTEWVSFQRALGQPVLLGFHAADRGRAIEALPDAQLVASAMATLRTLFGRSLPDPLDHQITRWATDPFARGSYSFHAVGSHPRMRTDLARPLEDRLYFAGEATERDHFGTAHGAYLSGLRAAKEMV